MVPAFAPLPKESRSFPHRRRVIGNADVISGGGGSHAHWECVLATTLPSTENKEGIRARAGKTRAGRDTGALRWHAPGEWRPGCSAPTVSAEKRWARATGESKPVYRMIGRETTRKRQS